MGGNRMAKSLAINNGVHSKSVWRRVRDNWQMYLFLLLPVAWLIIFKYVPMYGAQIAFRKYTVKGGFTGSEWVGLYQFIKFFTSYSCKTTIMNTLVLSVYSLVVGFPLPIIFALLLNSVRSKRWKSVVENVTYMPYFISAVVMVGMMLRIMDINTGIVANIYRLLTGNKQLPFNVMASGWGFRHLYVWSGVWQGTGWGSIIYMAALSSVDPQLHEAATIDGASRWKRLWHVDFPAIVPTIAITLILRMGSLMSIGFDKTWLLQNDANIRSSEVIATYVYKVGLANASGNNYSYSTAINFFNSIVNLVMISVVNKIANKVSGSGLW